MAETTKLPAGTYCICPEHDLLMPYRHVHWEWVPEEGCPVLTGPGEHRCGREVQVTTRSALTASIRQDIRERLLRDEAVKAAILGFAATVEQIDDLEGFWENLPAEEREVRLPLEARAHIKAALDTLDQEADSHV